MMNIFFLDDLTTKINYMWKWIVDDNNNNIFCAATGPSTKHKIIIELAIERGFQLSKIKGGGSFYLSQDKKAIMPPREEQHSYDFGMATTEAIKAIEDKLTMLGFSVEQVDEYIYNRYTRRFF